MRTLILDNISMNSLRVFKDLYSKILKDHPEFSNDKLFRDSLYAVELDAFDCGVLRNLPAIVTRLSTEVRVRVMREYIRGELHNKGHWYTYETYVASAEEMPDRVFFGKLNSRDIGARAFFHIIALDLARPEYQWGMCDIRGNYGCPFLSDYEMMGNREIVL